MRKVLLAIDDYEIVVTAENLFLRMGFDVLAVSRPYSLKEALFRFQPDCVFALQDSRKMPAKEVFASAKKWKKATVTFVMCQSSKHAYEMMDQTEVDVVLALPVEMDKFFKVFSDSLRIREGVLLEKFQRLQGAGISLDENEKLLRKSAQPQSKVEDVSVLGSTKRTEKYQKFLQGRERTHKPSQAPPSLRTQIKKLTKQTGKPATAEHTEFVKTLFRAGSSK